MKKQYITPAIKGHKLHLESRILVGSPQVVHPETIQTFGHNDFDVTKGQEDLKTTDPDFGPKPIEKATGSGWESL